MTPLPLDGNGPLYRQIYRALRSEILDGRLAPGDRLPSTRSLALDVGVSRNIAVLAYDQLLAEGYALARRGSGTIVAPALPEKMLLRAAPPSRNGRRLQPRLSPTGQRVVDLVRGQVGWEIRGPRLPYDFRFGRPSFGDFPHATWCRLLGRRARRASIRDLDYGPPAGRKELREAIADRLRRHRGVDCDPHRIVIVNGSQQALDIVSRVLLRPGDRVLLEEPHYRGARLVFLAAGARIMASPVDAQGIQVPSDRAKAKLAYVTPSHQFPTGVVMPLGRRLELLSWAERSGAVVFEDDYDSEYRYEGAPVQALQGLDRSGLVIYAGTFSKLMFPALRLGYLVVPETLVQPVVAAKALADTGTAGLEQLALADFIREGHFDRHLRRSRARNARRRTVLLEAIREHFDRAEVVGANAGLHVLVWLGGRVASISRKAEEIGVGVYTVSPYYMTPPARSGILLGYAGLTEKEIREGIRRLAAVLG